MYLYFIGDTDVAVWAFVLVCCIFSTDLVVNPLSVRRLLFYFLRHSVPIFSMYVYTAYYFKPLSLVFNYVQRFILGNLSPKFRLLALLFQFWEWFEM